MIQEFNRDFLVSIVTGETDHVAKDFEEELRWANAYRFVFKDGEGTYWEFVGADYEDESLILEYEDDCFCVKVISDPDNPTSFIPADD